MFLKNSFIFAASFILALFGAVGAAALEDSYEIIGVNVDGASPSSAQTVLAVSGLRPGDVVTLPADNKLQLALRNIWKLKQYSDVKIIVDKVTPLGVFLMIKVKETPRLKEVVVNGNDELSRDDIIKIIDIMPGEIISDYNVYLIKKKILAKYEEEGLAFAKIEAGLSSPDDYNFSVLNLDIQEGVEFRVEKIEFEGNENFDDGELESSFEETNTKYWWEFWSSSVFDKKEYEKDLVNLVNFYKSEGFIDAEIVRDTVVYNEEEETVDVLIEVFEGARIFIRNLEITGNTVFTSDYLKRRLDFQPGDFYDYEKFNSNLYGNEEQSDVSTAYLDNGFLTARFEKEETRVGKDSIDILIKIYENKRVRIRRIDIVGNDKTKDKVIRRELYTRPGDFFDKSAIIRSVRAIGVLQYFNPEKLRPDVKPVPNDATKVDLIYNVEERSTDTFNASIGFAGAFGLTLAIGFTFNNFSITEPLKGGGGQIFNFAWERGQASRMQNFSIGFTEPWLFDEPTTVGFNIFDSRINFGYQLHRTGASVNLGRRFRWPDDYWRGDWYLRFQRNDVGSYGGIYYRPGVNTEITVGQKYSRMSLDHLFFPTVGSKFSVSNYFAMGALGVGTTDYLKSEVTFDMYNPLMKIGDQNRLALYLGTRVGYIASFESDTTISPIELYYMGGNGLGGYGVTPFRGYDDRSIGPRNGGRVLIHHQAELRFAVSMDPMPIYVYSFAEAGNVWSSLKTTDPFTLKRSAGFGIKLMVQAIGVLGFSYGYGFDPDMSGKKPGWNFQFHLGQ